MKNRLKLLIFLLLPLFYACETEIDVTLPENKEGVVVEGFIELGEYAEVSLYKTLPYLSEIQLNNLLEQVVIQDALVIIKKGVANRYATARSKPSSSFALVLSRVCSERRT